MITPTELFRWGPSAYSLGKGGFLFDERGYTREIEYHLPRPTEQKVNKLRFSALLGHPDLNRSECRSRDRTLYRDLLERECASLKYSLTKRIRDEMTRNRQCAEVYRALRVTRLAMGHVTSSVRRLWRRIPSLCFRFPVRMAELASELSGDLRTFGITGVWNRKSHFLWDIFRPRNRTEGLQGGHLKRALPAPVSIRREAIIEDFTRRVSTPAQTPDGAEFREWISNWVDFFRPSIPPTHFDIDVGHSACLETKRGKGGRGGAASLVGDLIEVGKIATSKYAKWRDFMLGGIKKSYLYPFSLPIGLNLDFSRSVYLLTGCLQVLSPCIEHRKVCDIHSCTERGKHPRVCPVVILEKGNKTRIPTMTSVAEGILASVYRSAVQHWMISDPRISSSLRGEFPKLPFKKRAGWVWRSQDLTTATDDHDLESTPYLYKALARHIQVPSWWGEVIDMITGPHEVITSAGVHRIRSHYSAGPTLDWDITKYPHGVITRRCQFMGTATSWPLLPLVTMFAYEKSYVGPLVSLTRHVTPYPPAKGMSSLLPAKAWYEATSGQRATLKLEILLPEPWRSLDTTGDDCIAYMDRDHSARHTLKIERVGGKVSKSKDFEDPEYGIYTEVYLKDGQPCGVSPLGSLLDIHGVRSTTWSNVGRSYWEVAEKHGVSRRRRRKLLALSSFHPLVKAICSLGMPVSYPPQMGGIDYFAFQERVTRYSSGMVSRAAHWDREEINRRLGIMPWPLEVLHPAHRPVAADILSPTVSGPDGLLTGKEILADSRVKPLSEVLYEVMTSKRIGELFSRTKRWSQVEYDPTEVEINPTPVRYLQERIRLSTDDLCRLQPTWDLVQGKGTQYYYVPWDTVSAMAGPRMTLGPYGPSNPKILLHRRNNHSIPIGIG